MRIREWLRESRERLMTQGGLSASEASFEANLLLGRATGLSRQQLITRDDDTLDLLTWQLAARWLTQRIAGHPVAYLTGQQAFWDAELHITPWVLIPRPDTESLIEGVQSLSLPEQINALDMATGSGAIALTLQAIFPRWQVSASDLSPAALATAQLNARRLGFPEMPLYLSDWFTEIPGDRRYDLIVSNPPYVERDHPLMQEGDVRFEPDIALMDGSKDGLAAIRHLITTAQDWLSPSGWLALEHGYQQAPAVQALMIDAGYQSVRTKYDHGGNPRVTLGQHL